jgi:RNA polymerase sigma-70 factor (ECF subfamily)
MSSESDRLLVQQIRRGDARAWEHLITRYEGRLLAFVHRRLHDRSAGEDVVQDTVIGFLNSLPNYDETRELQTYLFTIASYKLTDYLRRIGRHPMQHVSDGASDVLHQKIDSHKAASSVARSHERKDLERDAVARSLTTLLDQWRQQGEYQRIKVLELLLVKGWANRDVAKFLKISEQQVANIRFAAVKKLGDHVRGAGLPIDIFPELKEEGKA